MSKEVNFARIYLETPDKIKGYARYIKNAKNKNFVTDKELAKELAKVLRKLGRLDKDGWLDRYRGKGYETYSQYSEDEFNDCEELVELYELYEPKQESWIRFSTAYGRRKKNSEVAKKLKELERIKSKIAKKEVLIQQGLTKLSEEDISDFKTSMEQACEELISKKPDLPLNNPADLIRVLKIVFTDLNLEEGSELYHEIPVENDELASKWLLKAAWVFHLMETEK